MRRRSRAPTATPPLGTTGNDTITALAGDDKVLGLAGKDTIDAGKGDDVVCGDGKCPAGSTSADYCSTGEASGDGDDEIGQRAKDATKSDNA